VLSVAKGKEVGANDPKVKRVTEKGYKTQGDPKAKRDECK